MKYYYSYFFILRTCFSVWTALSSLVILPFYGSISREEVSSLPSLVSDLLSFTVKVPAT